MRIFKCKLISLANEQTGSVMKIFSLFLFITTLIFPTNLIFSQTDDKVKIEIELKTKSTNVSFQYSDLVIKVFNETNSSIYFPIPLISPDKYTMDYKPKYMLIEDNLTNCYCDVVNVNEAYKTADLFKVIEPKSHIEFQRKYHEYNYGCLCQNFIGDSITIQLKYHPNPEDFSDENLELRYSPNEVQELLMIRNSILMDTLKSNTIILKKLPPNENKRFGFTFGINNHVFIPTHSKIERTYGAQLGLRYTKYNSLFESNLTYQTQDFGDSYKMTSTSIDRRSIYLSLNYMYIIGVGKMENINLSFGPSIKFALYQDINGKQTKYNFNGVPEIEIIDNQNNNVNLMNVGIIADLAFYFDKEKIPLKGISIGSSLYSSEYRSSVYSSFPWSLNANLFFRLVKFDNSQ